ncbi:MAG: peptidylprolyl isomerase [Elusimicrobia bacterium]|jgi:peptidyl-prolyl cis-trans isomerase A (cyclophilin A)|nr:peptidylprolyl isomerase [Elusimicrobiota bacterium]
MNRIKIIAALAIFLSTGALMAADGWKKQAGTYAVIETELGTIVCKLFPEKAPETVANFVGLAEGTKEFKDIKTGEMVKRPFYDGIVFHRVIPDFMIQTGDPKGQGTGGPGYQFEDEFDKSLRFDRKGILAMANSGPGTNGSQFFITVAPTTWLNDRHSIFGEVVEGQSVADAISKAPRDPNDRPTKTLSMKKVTIERVK